MTEGSSISIDFQNSLYSTAAIKKAAYRFGDRCHIQLEMTGDNAVRVHLTPKAPGLDLQKLLGEFQNEVLDQDLRESVAAETSGVRNLILAQAFSAAALIQPETDTGSLDDDPLRIATPEP